MRDLTKPERDALLAKYPQAKAIAVNNFLMTLGANPDQYSANMNLNMDKRMYKWNPQTVRAIAEGIQIGAVAAVEPSPEVCDECLNVIPDLDASMISKAHKTSCSLHPDNLV